MNFYPRPPRGGRLRHEEVSSMAKAFLSTPSARRATPKTLRPVAHWEISIHALREEGDRTSSEQNLMSTNFYPRPPRGGRPDGRAQGRLSGIISIHALREEGDGTSLPTSSMLADFYPRPPRGGRRPTPSRSSTSEHFYPRPPRGGRRPQATPSASDCLISIHALREEGDGPA